MGGSRSLFSVFLVFFDKGLRKTSMQSDLPESLDLCLVIWGVFGNMNGSKLNTNIFWECLSICFAIVIDHL